MAAVSTIVAVAAVAVAGVSAYEQKQQAKKAAKREKEARAVAQAEQAAQQTAQTRAQLREERIRRAQILQQSQNTGVGGSSGAGGSTGALATSVGANIAAASRQANSANAISGLQQQAADARTKGAEIAATGQLASSLLSAGGNIFAATASTAPPKPPASGTPQTGAFSPASQPNPYDLNNIFR